MNIQNVNHAGLNFIYQNTSPARPHATDETDIDFAASISNRARQLAADAPVAANPWNIPDAAALKAAFRSWQETATQDMSGDYQERIQRHGKAFEALMDKASAENGYADPIAFLKTLSSQELYMLQQVHSLAQPIQPGTLTEEGALNLLLPKNQRKDLDKDGFVMLGAAKTWVFPPVDAPAAVQQAWQQAVASQDESELVLQGAFLPPPGQSAYIGSQINDYLSLISERLAGARAALAQGFPWEQAHRRKQIDFLEQFLQLLSEAQGS